MDDAASSTRQKALAINLDATTYGTFAEIGAGQEVARWFFSVIHGGLHRLLRPAQPRGVPLVRCV